MLRGMMVVKGDEFPASSESVGLVGGVRVRLDVGVGADDELSRVERRLVRDSGGRPHLRREFVAPRAVAFAHAMGCP